MDCIAIKIGFSFCDHVVMQCSGVTGQMGWEWGVMGGGGCSGV